MVHCKAWGPLLLLWDFRELCLRVLSLSQDLSRPVSRLEGLAVHLSKLAVAVELWWLPKRLGWWLLVQAGVWLRASAV